MNRFFTNTIVAAILLFSIFKPVSAYYTNMPASVVVGQDNFTDDTGGVTSSKLNTGSLLRGLFIDPNGRLIVSDTSNHRVLIWNQVPTTNGKAADLVLGQPDFISNSSNNGGRSAQSLSRPKGVWSDGNKLFVFDENNSRILLWTTFPTQNQQAANIVIGQADMTNSPSTVCSSSVIGSAVNNDGMWIHNDKLLAVDTTRERVLIWNTIPTSNGVSADVVIGQVDMNTCDTAVATSQNHLNSPRGIHVDKNGKLYIADGSSANRILVWNSIPTSNNTSADVVVGQPDFTTVTSGTTSSKLSIPIGVYSTGDRLFVADNNNNRVLIFNSIPSSNGASADLVLGQSDLTSATANSGGLSASSLEFPHIPFIWKDKLLITDAGNSRLLIFNNVLSSPHLSVSKVEQLSGDSGKLKITGSTEIGERGRYSLSSVVASVNGLGYGNVTSKDNGRDNGDGKTLYEFTHEFEPWVNNNGDKNTWRDRGYTVALKAISSNAEEDEVLLFSPFTLKAMSKDSSSLEFSVPTAHWSTLVDKLSYYTVEVKKTGSKEWTKLFTPIPTSLTTNTSPDFTVTHNSSTGTITVKSSKTLHSGEYRIQAVSKTGSTFSSNTISHTSSSTVSYLPSLTLTTSWFPLQINKISGTTLPILSSFSSYTPKPLTTSTLTPTVSGIAPSYSTVYLQVTNSSTPTQKKLYKTTTTSNTSFSIPISLYPKSTLDTWVTNQHNTTVLSPISLTTNSNLAVLGEYVNKPTIKSGLW